MNKFAILPIWTALSQSDIKNDCKYKAGQEQELQETSGDLSPRKSFSPAMIWTLNRIWKVIQQNTDKK